MYLWCGFWKNYTELTKDSTTGKNSRLWSYHQACYLRDGSKPQLLSKSTARKLRKNLLFVLALQSLICPCGADHWEAPNAERNKIASTHWMKTREECFQERGKGYAQHSPLQSFCKKSNEKRSTLQLHSYIVTYPPTYIRLYTFEHKVPATLIYCYYSMHTSKLASFGVMVNGEGRCLPFENSCPWRHCSVLSLSFTVRSATTSR